MNSSGVKVEKNAPASVVSSVTVVSAGSVVVESLVAGSVVPASPNFDAGCYDVPCAD